MEISRKEFTDLIIFDGTEAAFKFLKERFEPYLQTRIVNYLKFKNCPDPEDCGEDVQQLTWGAVYIEIEKFRREQKENAFVNTAGWLFRIQRRYCIKDILKHIRERNSVSLEEFNQPDIIDLRFADDYPFTNSIESQLYRKEKLRAIRKYVLTLPKPQVTAFELFINDFTHREIAFFLGVTPECSRQWISRAARNIRRNFNKF
ncbi:MAG: sigma factor-like helix-turn-helix DNA-binding protein [Pyrinomonadaceae bacterium]